MPEEVHICGICRFAYANKKLANECEDWCRNHNSCSLQITKNAVGILKPLK